MQNNFEKQYLDYELAMRSMDKKEQGLSPEEKEEFEKMKVGAENVIKSFSLKRSLDNSKGENLLIITDSGADKLMIKALLNAGQKIAGDDCRIVVAPKTEHAAQEFGENIGEKMKTADAVLLVTSLSRSHSKETVELVHPKHSSEIISLLMESPALKNAFPELRNKYSPETLAKMLSERKIDEASMFPSKSRIISITNTAREILTEGGALENPIEMKERIDKFAEVMKGVEKVKIISKNGTDLILDIKVQSLAKETGIIDRPGTGSNFPSGEYGGSVDLMETNGTYVADGAIGMIGRPDKPIKLSLIPESNATILAQNAKNVKLDSYEKLQKIKSGRAGRNQQDARSKLLFK